MKQYLPLSTEKGKLMLKINQVRLPVILLRVALLFCFLFAGFSAQAQPVQPDNGIVYVKKGGVGNGSGSSWGNACAELAPALKAAETNATIKQIWIAAGTYYPQDMAGNGTTNRDKAFVLVKDVKIYGGFAGTETTVDARNWKANPTVL
ncbi:MAG: hypothetical protein LBN37_06890, partial [Bacteroidales bacterium]|nr:hypothetical protein [Bacteroidales bacterium]